jgi:hypothetical protein
MNLMIARRLYITATYEQSAPYIHKWLKKEGLARKATCSTYIYTNAHMV